MDANNLTLHDRVRTRKFSLSKKMSKRKSVENEKDGKRGKITSFFVSKERTEIGKFMVRVVHTLPRDYQLFDRSRDVKFAGLFKITSSRGNFQVCHSLYSFGKATFSQKEGRFSSVCIVLLVTKQ